MVKHDNENITKELTEFFFRKAKFYDDYKENIIQKIFVVDKSTISESGPKQVYLPIK